MSSKESSHELHVGKLFSSEQEICEFIDKYSKRNQQTFVKGRSSKLNSKKLKEISQLQYYSITYICKFGAKRNSEATGIRSAKTFKRDCSAFILIRIESDGQHYKIVKCCENHQNHDGLEAFYDHIPENRRPNDDEKKEILHEFSLGCKAARLQKYMREKYHKPVRAKDLRNIAARAKSPLDDDITKAVDILESDYKATVQIIKDESNDFQGLFYSTLDMQEIFRKFPEIVFVDGTYKLFKNRYTLILFAIEDGHGRSKVIGVGIICNETEPVLSSLMEAFKEVNESACNNIIGFMTDKDLTERYVIKKVFPHVKLFICQFHTLRTFNREVTTAKLNITMNEREGALFYIDKMVKSLSQNNFDYWYQEFKRNAASPVIAYYEKNWHPIKEEWVRYCIFKCNFGNFTNNRIESINSKLKGYLDKYNSLIKFIRDFFNWIQHSYLEHSYKDIQRVLKEDVLPAANSDFNSVKMQYKHYITDFAFEKVNKEIDQMKYITIRTFSSETLQGTIKHFSEIITASPDICMCLDNWSLMLPCRHILAIRWRCNLPLFSENLCGNRWKRSVNNILPVSTTQSNAQCLEIEENASSGSFTSTPMNRKTKIIKPGKKSIGEKRRKLKIITDSIISIASEETEVKFEQKYDLLKNLLSSWKKNQEMVLIEKSKSSDLENLSYDMQNINISNDNSIVRAPSPTLTIGRVKDVTCCTLQKSKNKKTKN